ncbi:hypothetical protein CA51_52890 [Rosistilla oblonga]|uniref:hypothetical protein n=1 Tax=Rosistilla oblonga TaxID=2527990 RepID=UPI00118A4330|nr:hypothetical protein [Rosistilla oblonga]QDV15375.1 hypothetical protein CA51_52890 [Rosistilla oblonga]
MSPIYSNPKNGTATTLPIEATWAELSERTDKSDTSALAQWIEADLERIENQLSDFITPNTLKKSLRSGR